MAMLLEKIRTRYLDHPARPQRGNPTGSQWGRCAAQLQMLRRPELSHPERLPMRARMVMELGHLVEDWWRDQVRAVYPDKLGLAQEPFYLPVPLDDRADVDRVHAMLTDGRLWGVVRPGFVRPYFRRDPVSGRIKGRLLEGGRDQRAANNDPRFGLGFVLDPDPGVLYAPTAIDNIVDDEDHGLIVLEAKALSNYGFRRALVGQFDREKRMQLAGMWAATGLPVCWLLYRKETAHLAQVLYLPGSVGGPTQVRYATSNGIVAVDYVRGPLGGHLRAPDSPMAPGDALWEVAETWTPYQPETVAEIQEHIRRVIFHDPAVQPWRREYGPDFACRKCLGVGRLPCGGCGTSGRTPTGKVHKPCGGAGMRPCVKCNNGQLAAAELRYPCTYCAVVHFCYPMATLTLDRKPHYTITRPDWDAAQLAVFPAEPVVEDDEEPDDPTTTPTPAGLTPGGRADETEADE